MADNHQHPTIIEPFSFTETRPGAEVNGPDLVSSQAQTFQLCVVAAFVAIPYSHTPVEAAVHALPPEGSLKSWRAGVVQELTFVPAVAQPAKSVAAPPLSARATAVTIDFKS